MQDHYKAILEERLNYLLTKRTVCYAELDTRGKRIECPNCHVQIIPTLGNWISDKFPCKSCKANLCFRNSTAKNARCTNNLIMLECGGCQARVLHQKRDKTVKCSECKHINILTVGRTYGVRPEDQAPPQVYRIIPPQVNQDLNQVPPQVNQAYRAVPIPQVDKDLPQTYKLVPCDRNGVVSPQVNQDPSHLYQVVPRQVNQVPPQVNRVIPPRVYQRRNRGATPETESTASSSFNPRPEIIVVEYPDDTVAETVRNVAIKREVEEDKTEEAGSKKKIRL